MNIHQRKIYEAVRVGLSAAGFSNAADDLADSVCNALSEAGQYGQVHEKLAELKAVNETLNDDLMATRRTNAAYHRQLIAWEMTGHQELGAGSPAEMAAAVRQIKDGRHD